MVDNYRKRISRSVIEMAKDDPELVTSIIDELEQTGQIEKGDLDYLRLIAKRWQEINEANVKRK